MGRPLPDRALLFVYGTLMAGEAAHALLAEARFLGTASTAPAWTMLDCGAFPALRPGQSAVVGELYELDAVRLSEIDAYEGHPTFFVRAEIALAGGGGAQTYILKGEHARGLPVIESGSWRAHRRIFLG